MAAGIRRVVSARARRVPVMNDTWGEMSRLNHDEVCTGD